jgi:hypothetical protein
MEAEGYSEMLLLIYQTTWHHIPEDHNCSTHYHESLKSDASAEILFTNLYYGKGNIFFISMLF